MNDERAISPRLLLVLVIVCSIAAFILPIDGTFIFDDRTLVSGNRFVHGFSHWQHWFSRPVWDTNLNQDANKVYVVFWRPAILASFAFDWWLGKGSAFVFHLTNLLAHAAVSALAFVTLRRWSRSAAGAFVGALFFALHPSKAECVSWISGRTDVLCALGIFIALQGLARRMAGHRDGVVIEDRGAKRSGLRLSRGFGGGAPIVIEIAGTALAYLSKEQAVVLPAFIAVEAWAATRTIDRKNLVRAIAPQAATAAAYLVFRHFFLPIGHATAVVTFGTHVAYMLESLGRYVALIVWPGDLSLGRAQRVYVHGVATPVWPFVIAGALTIVAVTACVWMCRRRAPAISAGLLLTAVSLAPVCNIVWMGYFVLISPRFLYLPIFGLAFVIAEGVAAFDTRRSVALRAACAVVVVALGARSISRSADFASEDAFWSYEIARNPTYSPALMHQINKTLDAGRPRAALHDAIEAHDKVHMAEHRSAITLLAVRATLELVPDLARDALVAIRTFLADVRDDRDARLTLPPLGLELSLGAKDPESIAMRQHSRLLLESLEGEIASRLGDDAAARRAASDVAAQCTDCTGLLLPLTRVAARAGDLDLASALLSELRSTGWTADAERLSHDVDKGRELAAARRQARGPYRTVLDTRYFVLFGAWGRAYEAAKPAIESGETLDPETARELGDLCFRAGDTPTARKLLGRSMPPDAVKERLDALALEMHWVDAP